MKQLISFVSFLNKKKFLLASFVLSFFVLATIVVQAQTTNKFLLKNQVTKDKTELSPTKDINKSTQNSFKTGGTDLGQFIGGSAETAACSGTGSCSTGKPGAMDYILQYAARLMIGSQRQEITLASGETQYIVSTGAVQMASSIMAKMYISNPSSSEYVADLMENIQAPLGVKPAYAQGLGFSALRPVLEMWKLFRNLAYFFFVVIFLVVGIMIMFRSKIGGKAAVTVQQALPKIVVSLLLVTFSYAIAGLMIDLMYIVIYLMIGVFSSTAVFAGGQVQGVGSLVDVAFRNTLFQNFFALWGSSIGYISGAVQVITSDVLATSFGLDQNNLINSGLSGIANILTFLIITVYLLVSVFRVFFQLLQAYVGIFFSVVFAPIQLLLGAIPGQNTFESWLKGLVENLAVFPTIIFLILLGMFFANPASRPAGFETGGFTAPQLGSNQTASAQNTYIALISLGIIGAIPEVVKIAKGLLKGQIGVDAGSAVKNLAQGWKGGEIIPGIGFTKIGVSTAPSQARDLWSGNKEFRRKQDEREMHGKQRERGGLSRLVVGPAENLVRWTRYRGEQKSEVVNNPAPPAPVRPQNVTPAPQSTPDPKRSI